MIVYPAMDLMDGRAVRLRQGRFDDSTVYDSEPEAALAAFAEAGARWAHVVDLDGARARKPRQHQLIGELARNSVLAIQGGGGFRTRDHVARALEAGIDRVVVGSIAIVDPDLVNRLIEDFGENRICLSLDVSLRNNVPFVKTAGWADDSGLSLWEAAARLPAARHALITDISRDGMLTGPNLTLYAEAVRRLPHLLIQASGGVRSMADLTALPTAGAIVGKAYWEGRIDLREALGLARA